MSETAPTVKTVTREEFLGYTKRKAKGKCRGTGCKNDQSHGDYCDKCRKRWWRYENLHQDRYNNLKHNAKRRGIYFGLTIDEFVKICELTGYTADGHVSFGDRLSLDRIERDDGYILSNLRVISVRNNSRRYVNPRILVNGEWLDHSCVDFSDDPLNDLRKQAVEDKIAKSVQVSEEVTYDNDDDTPAWLRTGDPF